MLRKEFLEPLRLTQAALASRMGVAPNVVCAIVHGKRSVDAEMAALLSKALRTSRGFWTALQADQDRWLVSAGLENDERFLARTKAARASLRARRGTRLEDV
jgi:addiction module HigA family antidote